MNNMNRISVTLILGLSMFITGCSSENKEEGIYDNVTAAPTVAAADDPNQPTAEPGKAKEKTDLGDGLKDDKPVVSEAPTDNGLTIALPSLEETPVSLNEQVKFVLAQQEPGTKFTGSFFYYDDGANNANFEVGEYTVDKDGFATAEVVIPSNLTPGTYTFALDSGNGLYTATLIVK